MAGLLTYSRIRTPSRKNQWQKCCSIQFFNNFQLSTDNCQLLRSLQQRVLFRIYTGFPFIGILKKIRYQNRLQKYNLFLLKMIWFEYFINIIATLFISLIISDIYKNVKHHSVFYI